MEENSNSKRFSGGFAGIMYQPSTEDTREAYEALLSVVEQQLGGHPSEVIRRVANEVLSVLKCDNFKNPLDKKVEIERVLNPIADHMFEQLVRIGECITNYYFQDSSTDDHQNGFYQPRTEDTWTAYKLLLSVVEDGLCDQPQIVHCVVAHEILLILKNESVKRVETRREMIESLLNRVPDHTYDFLVFISGLIQDFKGPCDTMKSEDQNVVYSQSGFDSCINGDWKVENQSKVTTGPSSPDHQQQPILMFSRPGEMKKRNRVAKYRVYREVEKKGSFMSGFRWIKSKCSQIISGFMKK